jgi:hypothetical protein
MRRTIVLVATVIGLLASSACASSPNNADLGRACDQANEWIPDDFAAGHWDAYADRLAQGATSARDRTAKLALMSLADSARDYARDPRHFGTPGG